MIKSRDDVLFMQVVNSGSLLIWSSKELQSGMQWLETMLRAFSASNYFWEPYVRKIYETLFILTRHKIEAFCSVVESLSSLDFLCKTEVR